MPPHSHLGYKGIREFRGLRERWPHSDKGAAIQVNQRLQFMLLAVVGGLMGGISSGYLLHTGAVYAQPGTERAVVAKRFQLVGDDGQLRGFFSADADGTAILSLADKKGKPRIGLAVKPDGSPSVNVYGVNGIQQVTFGVAGNQAGLSVRTETSDRAFIGVSSGGNSRVEVFGRDGKRLWGAP